MNALTIPTFQMSDMERIARALAASKLFGVTTPDQALALCLIAQSEGRHPASAAQDYHVISGRPAKKADAMLRDFISSGGRVEWHELSDHAADATFSHQSGGTVRISWDMDRAKRAQLTTAMWSKYPRQMLRSRVVSEGVRTVYPGATSGMYEPGEVQDIVAQEPANVQQLRVVSPQSDSDIFPGDLPSRGPERMNASQAKKAGLYEPVMAALDAIDSEEALDAWIETLDQLTAQWPIKWLEPLRDRCEAHRVAILDQQREALGL